MQKPKNDKLWFYGVWGSGAGTSSGLVITHMTSLLPKTVELILVFLAVDLDCVTIRELSYFLRSFYTALEQP